MTQQMPTAIAMTHRFAPILTDPLATEIVYRIVDEGRPDEVLMAPIGFDSVPYPVGRVALLRAIEDDDVRACSIVPEPARILLAA